MSAFFCGVFEKLIAAVIIGVIFFAIMILSAWLIDILPTKLALIKAAEMTDEPDDFCNYLSRFWHVHVIYFVS